MGVLRKTGPMSVADRRVSPANFADRCRERDQRQAADDRNDVQRLLGDPPHYGPRCRCTTRAKNDGDHLDLRRVGS